MRKEIKYDHFSISQVNEFARCPRFYYYHRMRGLPLRPLYDLASGKALHAGLETHNKERVRGKGLTHRQIIEVAVANLEAMPDASELDVSLGEAKDQLSKDGRPPTATYVNETERDLPAPASDEHVEKLVEATIEDRPFVAYIDVQLPDRLIDYKLLGRRKSAAEIERDPQLVLYSTLIGLPAGFVQLVRGREQADYAEARPAPAVAAGVLAWIVDTVKQIEAAKTSGIWPRTAPTNWMCNNCPFFGRCFREKETAPVCGAKPNADAA